MLTTRQHFHCMNFNECQVISQYSCNFIGNLNAGGGNPFLNIDKTTVLQETRMFNETPVNARKCTHILTKILYFINQVIPATRQKSMKNTQISCIFRAKHFHHVKQLIASLP